MKITLGNKNITIRKWKGKDKKEFIQNIKSDDVSDNEVLNSLVYNCIAENVILSLDEIKYVLSKIRILSLGDELDFKFYCDKCKKYYKRTLKISDLITYTSGNIKDIKVKNTKIKLTDIRNKDFYNKYLDHEDYEIYDFLLRIEKIDNNDTFTLEELISWFDDLDLDVSEEIIKQYNKENFTIQDVNTVTCDCGAEDTYKFDELPEFFPKSWFE